MMNLVTKASLIIEVDGEVCAVLLNDIPDLNDLVRVVAGLSSSQTLTVVPLNDSFKWENFSQEDYKKSNEVKT